MTISFDSIPNGIKFYAQKAVDISSKASSVVLNFPAVVGSTLSGLLLEQKPILISEIIEKIQTHGSALLKSKEDLLIEITKDEMGRNIFKASGNTQNPRIIIQNSGDNGLEKWKVNVSKYLKQFIGQADSISYGVCAKRWKENAFPELKEKLIAEGHLQIDEDKVSISSSEEGKTLVFNGHHANLKADIVLKQYYQKRSTPTEEAASRPLNVLTSLFLGYLYTSGQHPNLSSSVTTTTANLLTSSIAPTALLTGMISLIPSVNAAPVPSEIEKTDAIAKNSLARRTNPISIVYPLPNLNAQPGITLTEQINLEVSYQLSNPFNNLELSIQQHNKTAVPSWLSMDMGDLTLLKSFGLGTSFASFDAINVGNYAYLVGQTGLKIVDITNPNNPILLGSYSTGTYSSITVIGNYAICSFFQSNHFDVLNISNPASITLVTTYTFPYTSFTTIFSGNYVYAIPSYNIGAGTYTNYFYIVNIANPAAPSLVASINLGTATQNFYFTCVSGKYAYMITQGSGVPSLMIYDVSNPSSPVFVKTMSQYIDGAVVKNNYLFSSSGTDINTYDITQITNPILLQSFYLGVSLSIYPLNLSIQGNYLYVFGQISGLKVFNIQNPANAYLVASFDSLGSGSFGGFVSGNNILVADEQAGLTIINAQQRVLSGTPTLADRGLLLIDAITSDNLGNNVTQTFSIHVGDIDVSPIPNQQVYVGNTTMLTFNPGTFDFPNAAFNYTASLVGGVPLPSFVGFDPSSRTFIFAPRSGNQNSYQIQVTADDLWGGVASTTFNLVVPDRPPVIAQPLSNQTATSGEPFLYTFTAFPDSDLDIITYSAALQGTSGLPGWLAFNQATRTFSGTPFGRGNYPLVVTGNDGFGGTISDTFSITVPSTPPFVLNPIGTQTASAGTAYSFTVNTNTFFDIDNDPLTYSASSVPPFLTFYNATRTFIGTPQSGDVGSYLITIEADAIGGSASTSFNLNVASASTGYPPILEKQIPNVLERAGTAFSFTFDANTFVDPENGVLTYDAELVNNQPLPAGLNFDSATRTLSGIVQDPQVLTILVRATNPSGAFALDTFTLTVVESAPPVVLNPLTNAIASVGQKFTYIIQSNTFIDSTNDPLTITVLRSNGKTLPHWLKWDKTTYKLEGTPTAFDAGTIQTNQVDVDVWASDGVGSSKTSFTVFIEGESFWSIFIKVGASLSSILATGYGVYENRARLWNFFNKKQYRDLESQPAWIGGDFSYEVHNDYEKIGKMDTYLNGVLLMGLPAGLTFNRASRTISGTVEDNATLGRYTINIYNHAGYCIKEFDLCIKKNASDANPPEHPGLLDSMRTSASKCIPHRSSSGEEDSSGGGKGRSFMMSKLDRKGSDSN